MMMMMMSIETYKRLRPRKDVKNHMQSLLTAEGPEIWRGGHSGSHACLDQAAEVLSLVIFCGNSLCSLGLQAPDEPFP